MSPASTSELNLEKYETLLAKNMPRLQMLPAIAIEALELVKQPECPVQEFAAIVERDVTLASSMLKIANSPVYSLRKEISSLREAVVRLGFRVCKNLIMSSCVSTLTKKLSFEDEWVRDLLWRHSLYTAAIAHHLNQRFLCGFQGEEFTAALLHDLGRLLIASLFPKEFLTVDPLSFDEREDPTFSEIEVLGICHTRLAELFARVNNLPEDLTAVMRWHHSPAQAMESRKLVSLIAVADDMANYYQRTGSGENYDVQNNPAMPEFIATTNSFELNHIGEFAAAIINDAADDMHSSNSI